MPRLTTSLPQSQLWYLLPFQILLEKELSDFGKGLKHPEAAHRTAVQAGCLDQEAGKNSLFPPPTHLAHL